jgi:conjugative transposon TraM protein
MKKMKSNSNTKLLMLIVPVALAGIVFAAFFLNEKEEEIPDTHLQQQAVVLPDAESEDKPASKIEAYKQEELDRLHRRRENDASIVTSSDFFRDVESEETLKGGNNIEVATGESIVEMYETTVSGPAEPKLNTNTNNKQKNNAVENNNNKKSWVAATTASTEESNIDKLYNKANEPTVSSSIHEQNTSTTTQTPVSTSTVTEKNDDENGSIIQDGKRRRNKNTTSPAERNLIAACIHGDQTITTGGAVRMRLLEGININNTAIPANTLFYGVASTGNDRLQIRVDNIKYGNAIIQVQYTIYDVDAIQGLNLPDNIKHELAKKGKSAAIDNVDLSTGGGTVGNIITSGVNTIKSVVQKEEGEIKVALKANYKLFITTSK